MSNRTGRAVRRALAALVGLGGLGLYATAQQPKPLVIKSTGTPGVYAVSEPEPAANPKRPANVLPGVPTPPVADTTVTRDTLPVVKPSILPGVPLPLPETAVTREAMPLAPLAPKAPNRPAEITPVGLAVPQAPLAPVPPVVVVPTAPAEPAVRAPRIVVEQASAPLAPMMPAAPAPLAQSPPVLLAPVPAPEPIPITPTPAKPYAGTLPATPVVPPPEAVPTVRTPIVTAPIRYRHSGTVVAAPATNPLIVSPPTLSNAPAPTPTPTVVTSTVAPSSSATCQTPGCGKPTRCPKGKAHCDCCVCAPATVPPPVGSAVRSAFGIQRANALEEYCVVFREEFDRDADTLNPTGERHIGGIARRFNQTQANVKIEPSGDVALDQRRIATVISELTKAGVPVEVASSRVQSGNTRAEGMPATDIEPAYARHSLGGYYGGLAPTYGGFATFGPLGPYASPWR